MVFIYLFIYFLKLVTAHCLLNYTSNTERTCTYSQILSLSYQTHMSAIPSPVNHSREWFKYHESNYLRLHYRKTIWAKLITLVAIVFTINLGSQCFLG